MLSNGRRYPGVKGKTVEYIQTHNEQDNLYLNIRFTDKTCLNISIASNMFVHSAGLYDASTGDDKILKDYVLPKQS